MRRAKGNGADIVDSDSKGVIVGWKGKGVKKLKNLRTRTKVNIKMSR